MTQSNNDDPQQPTYLERTSASLGPQPVTFLNKLIAFAVLVIPYALLFTFAQELVLARAPQANALVMFALIVLFLFGVGKLARIIQNYRAGRITNG